MKLVMFMTIVFTVSDNVKNRMISFYADKRRQKTPPYAIFQADDADTNITLYNSGKVVFQGNSADIEAQIIIDNLKVNHFLIVNLKRVKIRKRTR